MKSGFYSHPGKRSNPEHHGTIDRFAVGCRCWRCRVAFQKFAIQKWHEAEARRPASLARA